MSSRPYTRTYIGKAGVEPDRPGDLPRHARLLAHQRSIEQGLGVVPTKAGGRRQPKPIAAGTRYPNQKLVILGDAPRRNPTIRLVRCRCDCGNITVVSLKNLRCGSTLSCGCHRRNLRKTHGGSYLK